MATIRDGAPERLSRMIQLPTVSAELEQRGMAPFQAFEALIAQEYPLVHEHLTREHITDLGLVFHWRSSSDADPLVLMAHYDVVPVDENDAWTYPPFEGVIADGHVYGRGVLDDKGALLVILEAVENLLTDGFTPARDVYLSFGGNEESHGAAAAEIARVFQERGIMPWLVLDEGGAIVEAPLPAVQGAVAMVGVGEKGLLSITLTAVSDGGHSSFPPPLTTVGRVSRAITKLTPGTFRPRTPQAITRLLGILSQRATPAAKFGYGVLSRVPWITGRLFAKLGGEPAALVRTTVAPTMLTGGTADNVVPSRAVATVNFRIAIGETVESTVERVRKRINDPEVRIDVLNGSNPTAESETTNAQFAHLAECIGVSHPDALVAPYVVMAATDARWFQKFAPAVYRFAPFRMSSAQRAAIHGVDERIAISELTAGEVFYRTLLERLPAR